jgi:predicted ATP-dependent Lon-type protease
MDRARQIRQERNFTRAEQSRLSEIDTQAIADWTPQQPNQDAVKKTVAGMLKLLHPHRTAEELSENEIVPLIEFAIEMRKRTTDQLAKVLPAEFSNADYTYSLRQHK